LTSIIVGCGVFTSNSAPKSLIPGEKVDNYTPPKYKPKHSITYNKPYTELIDELLYARIVTGDDSTGRKTVSYIEDKERLVHIVKEFDKLKSIIPQNECLDLEIVTCYTFIFGEKVLPLVMS